MEKRTPMRRRSLVTIPAVSAVAFLTGRAAQAQQATITGAGGFLPRPLYERWSQMAREGAGIQLTCQRLGAAGLEKLLARQVDFAVADYPRRAALLRENSLIQFPAGLGAMVPFANLPGVADGRLRLSGEALADIYLGKITRWNAPALVALNGDLRLPDLAVTPVHRAGATAASYNFSTYLSRVSETWAAGPRAATEVKWPAGVSAEANEGVAEKVRATPGAIGYADGAFAKANGLASVLLKNRAGAFVKAAPDSYAEAAAAGDWSPANFITDMIDLDAPGAWPIVTPSLVLTATNPTAEKVQSSLNTLKFFDWAYRNGGTAFDGEREVKAVVDRVVQPDGQAERGRIELPVGVAQRQRRGVHDRPEALQQGSFDALGPDQAPKRVAALGAEEVRGDQSGARSGKGASPRAPGLFKHPLHGNGSVDDDQRRAACRHRSSRMRLMISVLSGPGPGFTDSANTASQRACSSRRFASIAASRAARRSERTSSSTLTPCSAACSRSQSRTSGSMRRMLMALMPST
jgi:phosphate transport system substrate-binding protein